MLTGVLDWLDLHSAAVQAVSAVLLLLVTAVYVALTFRLLNEDEAAAGPRAGSYPTDFSAGGRGRPSVVRLEEQIGVDAVVLDHVR